MLARSAANLCTSVASVAFLAAWLPGGAMAQVAQPQQPDKPPVEAGAHPRTVTFAVPLVWRGGVRGDVTVQIVDGRDVAIDTASLRRELRPLLNDAGLTRLDSVIAAQPLISPAILAEAGFDLEFDMSRLELRLTAIDQALRPVENLDGPEHRESELPITDQPAAFSAYLNSNVSMIYREGEGLVKPDVFWSGAVRAGGIVVEGEAGLTEDLGTYRVFRQGVRAIYDQPGRLRRWSAGDLQLTTTTLTQMPQLGGIALERRRRTFDPSFSFRALSGHRISVETPSTVEVLVNGAPFKTLDLQPGTYDLSSLPVEAGANDIQLVVRDSSGRQTVTRLDTFFDPPDLEPGEDEYTVAMGVVSENLGLSPDYDGAFAAIANYRRALSNNLLLGGGVQLSRRLQLAATPIENRSP